VQSNPDPGANASSAHASSANAASAHAGCTNAGSHASSAEADAGSTHAGSTNAGSGPANAASYAGTADTNWLQPGTDIRLHRLQIRRRPVPVQFTAPVGAQPVLREGSGEVRRTIY
jgi:hypothetical protein